MQAYSPGLVSWSSPIWDINSTPHSLTGGIDVIAPAGFSTEASSDAADLIFAGKDSKGRSVWQNYDVIDGGGGVNTIRGYFPGFSNSVIEWSANFSPHVTNVQRAKLMVDRDLGSIDFSNWTGLKYLDLDGTLGPSSLSLIPGASYKIEFQRVPVGTLLAINDDPGHTVQYTFAGAISTQTADLNLTNAGKSGAMTSVVGLGGFANLKLHVSGKNFVDASTAKMTVIDGAGNLTLKDEYAGSHKLDASKTTGAFHLVADGLGETITFGSGADIYETFMLHNIQFSALASPADLDNALVVIDGFRATDKLMLHIPTVAYDLLHAAQTKACPTLKDAAEFVASHNQLGTPTLDVFQWGGSTYVLADQTGNQHFDLGDGLIKLNNFGANGEHLTGLNFA
jgi:hypothetical protein